MGKLTKDAIDKLLDRPGRHGDGDGLYFRAIGERRAYWVYRYRPRGKNARSPSDRTRNCRWPKRGSSTRPSARSSWSTSAIRWPTSAPPRPARATPAPQPSRPSANAPTITSPRTQRHGETRRTNKRMTLTTYCAPIRSTPVDKVDTEAVLSVLKPLWMRAPETASRLRGRIEAVLASAQVDGHIHSDRTNPARWRGWLDRKLANPKKIGERGHYTALPYADLPEFMARLGREPGTVAKALAFIILTAARSGEALGMTWEEVDLATATWTIPASRMKAGKAHIVPLSDQAISILRGQMAARGKNPHVFPSHLPRQALWSASLALVMRRLGTTATTHGMRASFRMWAADQGIAFEVAEQCLAHTVGSAVVQAYQRSSMLERRRPVMDQWASYVIPKPDAKVIKLRRTRA